MHAANTRVSKPFFMVDLLSAHDMIFVFAFWTIESMKGLQHTGSKDLRQTRFFPLNVITRL
ncbi:MAG: hypothetical protein CVU57_29220 [Deltaproteobacteria bacterium HGW-Deltaproteobacteria-15]|nr:MAG: hypothetical protein CVU57_29220 [Deltaproteobacteria bacterium HGW-Deltaproteobacteria-15]